MSSRKLLVSKQNALQSVKRFQRRGRGRTLQYGLVNTKVTVSNPVGTESMILDRQTPWNISQGVIVVIACLECCKNAADTQVAGTTVSGSCCLTAAYIENNQTDCANKKHDCLVVTKTGDLYPTKLIYKIRDTWDSICSFH